MYTHVLVCCLSQPLCACCSPSSSTMCVYVCLSLSRTCKYVFSIHVRLCVCLSAVYMYSMFNVCLSVCLLQYLFQVCLSPMCVPGVCVSLSVSCSTCSRCVCLQCVFLVCVCLSVCLLQYLFQVPHVETDVMLSLMQKDSRSEGTLSSEGGGNHSIGFHIMKVRHTYTLYICTCTCTCT